MANQRNNKMGICPWCGEFRRDLKHPLCSACNRKFDQRVREAETGGKIFLRTRPEFARMKGKETLVRLQTELKVAQEQKAEFYDKAREIVMSEFRATDAVSVDRTELNRKAGQKFGELLGDSKRANEIWAILNGHEHMIELIEEFIAYKEEDGKESSDGNEKQAQEVAEEEGAAVLVA